MFNIVDITDLKDLKTNDKYFQIAKLKAHSEIESFLNYLRKHEFVCSVLIPKDLKNLNNKRKWCLVEYLSENELYLLENKENKTIIPIDALYDWIVKIDDMVIGNYTLKALAEKATLNGETLSRKSKRILERIVT